MGLLFGTDGVRGIANRELTPELAFKLGRAGAYILCNEGGNNKIVIGKDTRISGDMLEAALVAGICSVGVNVLKVGVMPTPAIAFLTRSLGAAAGVVISASHNPVEDNGIKFFGASGFKLPDVVESDIEEMVLGSFQDIPVPVGINVGRTYEVKDAVERYISFLKETVDVDLTGLKIVVDCANGAAYKVAPRILMDLGAEVVPIFNYPDGVNINKGCGSTHPEFLQRTVVEEGADLGFAHDGDADRVLAVDHEGNLIDGDQIMVACAKFMKESSKLTQNTVVVTVMSNLGLHLALQDADIKTVQTKVGDRYVLEELLRTGARFGGEQSGHIIFLDYNTTGDGIVTALQLLQVMKKTGRSLKDLAGQMDRLPQILENARVTDKIKIMNSPEIKKAIQKHEAELAGQGRILVRPSGTEPLVRVMVEGRDINKLRDITTQLIKLIEEHN
ncbi:phosphoglucosamine mutase [Desulfolucanica intricata]|uniref:phosphoglucosamine mutase n=1 Tax=Desulfolucanica intricata TaxID=1285191 RepID=UPI00082EE038|nr:phosphoglucosamine mutase [Desulfolucanica intricata]